MMDRESIALTGTRRHFFERCGVGLGAIGGEVGENPL